MKNLKRITILAMAGAMAFTTAGCCLLYTSTDPGSRVMEEIQHRLDRESGPFQVVLGGQAWNISMEHSDYLDMYVAYIVPQDVLLRDLNELSRIAVMLLVLGGGLAVALAVGSSKVMSRGVSRVMEGIEAIELSLIHI